MSIIVLSEYKIAGFSASLAMRNDKTYIVEAFEEKGLNPLSTQTLTNSLNDALSIYNGYVELGTRTHGIKTIRKFIDEEATKILDGWPPVHEV